MNTLTEPERQTPITDYVDVLVLGGGPAGIHAAVSAARLGAKTMLVERYGFFGGMATAGLVGPLLGIYHWDGGRRIVGGTAWEMLTKMAARDGALLHEPGLHVPFDPEVLKFVADQMIVDSGVIPRLHSFAVSSVVESDRITAVVLESKSGREAVAARVVIDSTGDGDIAARSGVRFQQGREKDGALQPLTFCFRLSHVDLSKVTENYSTENGYSATEVRKIMLEAYERGELPVFGGPWIMKGSTVCDDEAYVNVVRLWGDATNAVELSLNEILGRKQTVQFVDFFRKRVAGLEKCRLMDSASHIGVRETRRFVGEYLLTTDDIYRSVEFSDSIAMGGHIIDIHNVSGAHDQRRDLVPPYQIPYRCLVPKTIDNLLIAGRPISSTPEAYASSRVMGTCMAVGQGAGLAAALAANSDARTKQVDVGELRRILGEVGAITE